MNQWTGESINRWSHEPVNQWISESSIEPTNQWFNESLNQWTNCSTNQWIDESRIQGINESMNRWINARLNQWISEAIIEYWINESMNQSLRWDTSSLSYFFSEQPLIRATSALSCLRANSFVASATQFFSSRSCYNAFSNLQHPAFQEHRSITHALLRAAMPINVRDNGDSTTQIRLPKVLQRREFFSMSKCKSLLPVLCTFCRPPSSPASSVLYMWKCKSSSCYSPAHFLSYGDHGATLPEKIQGFAPESVFTRDFPRGRTVTLPNYLTMGGWHDDVVYMMVGMRRQSSVTRKFST